MPANQNKAKGSTAVQQHKSDSSSSSNNNNNNKNKNSNNTKNKASNGHNEARKSKKQMESEEFDRILSDLNKATKAVGKQRQKQAERDEKNRQEREEKHKTTTTEKAKDVEKDFDMMLRRKQQKAQFQQLLQQLLSAQRPFLDAPNTEFHSATENSNPHFDVAVGEMQGWRVHMEDEHVVDVSFPDGAADSAEGLFCVFDGHSGKGCATQCAQLIPTLARKYATRDNSNNQNNNNNNNKNSTATTVVDFEKVYLEADAALATTLKDDSGCTAVSVHVTPTHVTCASVGDSRAVLCRSGAAVDLAHDHKPENDAERCRIEAAGGSVSENRVNGQLAMSRAMGDFTYKAAKDKTPQEQQVIAVPDVIRVAREKNDTFVVVACDGIFDVLENQELIEQVISKKKDGKSNTVICEEICRECLAPMAETGGQPARAEGTDNMTLMIIDLK